VLTILSNKTKRYYGISDKMADNTGSDPEKLELQMSMGFSGMIIDA